MNEKRGVYIFVAIVSLIMLVVAFTLNGTADSGDSVYHFLYAKYAFSHTDNFFDAWAKPLYVLLASPFAHFGFTGIKIFNILNTIVAMIAAYFTGKKLDMQNSWFVPVLLIVAPMNVALAFSGLTEPLFGTIIICGLCLLFYDKTAAGLIMLSFLPFVRSEGMFLLIIVAVYLCIVKKYISVLWLATGQALYAVVGYFKFKSLLWFYESNPYSLVSKYGHGKWFDYVDDLPLVIGYASKLLLGVGILAVLVNFAKSVFMHKKGIKIPWNMMLVLSLFVAYFMFHVIAWKYGLFASFGMVRIIVAMAPLMAILVLYGINAIVSPFVKNTVKARIITIVVFGLVVATNVVYFIEYISSSYGVPGFSMKLESDQEIQMQMADYIKHKYPDYKSKLIIYDATFLAMALDVDPFDGEVHQMTLQDGKMPDGSFCIWDEWFSVVEGGITLDTFAKDPAVVRDTSFAKPDAVGKERKVILFIKK